MFPLLIHNAESESQQQDRAETGDLVRTSRSRNIRGVLVNLSPFNIYWDFINFSLSGLSTSFWMMIFVRSITGALNGNVAVGFS